MASPCLLGGGKHDVDAKLRSVADAIASIDAGVAVEPIVGDLAPA